MLRLFDAHCHLQDARLGSNVAKIIQEAQKRGVKYFACNGCWEGDWQRVEVIARDCDAVIPNFGLHPWWVNQRTEGWLERLRELLLAYPEAGLGECGLDHARAEAAGPEEQAEVFSQQLHLGQQLQRPVSVHCVRAFGALSGIVQQAEVWRPLLHCDRQSFLQQYVSSAQALLQQARAYPAGLVLHSWAGSADMTRQLACIEGVYFSISGHTLGLSDKKLAPMLQQVPLGRLLLETDSPDGLPALQRRQGSEQGLVNAAGADGNGCLNHPANIRAVLGVISSLMHASEESVAEAAFSNSCRIFGVKTE